MTADEKSKRKIKRNYGVVKVEVDEQLGNM
jgi:hypothetical protein